MDEEKLYEEKLYTLETDSAEKDTVDQELMKHKANRKAAKKDLAEIAKAAQTLGSFGCETLTSFSEQKTSRTMHRSSCKEGGDPPGLQQRLTLVGRAT